MALKKPRKLPPRGEGGKFIKAARAARAAEPQLVESPAYSPMRVGIDPIDWQRELTREVMPPRRRLPPKLKREESNRLGWAVVVGGVGGIAYLASRLGKGKRPL
jgi:hypothetical protein